MKAFGRLIITLCGVYASSTLLAAQSNLDHKTLENIERFSNVMSQIKNYYVMPVDEEKLYDDAIRGMVSSLDPHSVYLNKEELSELKSSTSGEFGGLGIEMTLNPENELIVVAPRAGSPAEKAGVLSGDSIIKINNFVFTNSTRVQDAVKVMRGEVGSPVELTIIRKNVTEPLKFTLKRALIKEQTVAGKILDNDFAYVRLNYFQAHTGQDFQKTYNELAKGRKKPFAGMILDLRNNPGGLVDAAVSIASQLLGRGSDPAKAPVIVYTKGRTPDSQFIARSQADDITKGIPLVVLINEGSASASEIVAGALQDNRRAVLVGKRSFGKGSVQTILLLGNNRGLKLTTALYYTPSGRSIQATGIEPNIRIDNLQVASINDKDFNYKESDLAGHISNQTAKGKQNLSANSLNSSEIELAKKDYQMYEALNVLKTMATLQKQPVANS
jgi:carboxyl-terminal processing protease